MSNITKIIEINNIYSREEYTNRINIITKQLGLDNAENNPDILTITLQDKKSIGIKEIKKISQWIYLKPFKYPKKITFITHGDLLTIEAQNALLKITEEPPTFAHIYIFVNSHKNLLQTIISRSQIVSFKTNEDIRLNKISKFLHLNSIDRFKYCDKKAKESTDSIDIFIDELILHFRDLNKIQLSSKLIKYKVLLGKNINKKLILTNLCIDLEPHKS